jgi:hypothetical protein
MYLVVLAEVVVHLRTGVELPVARNRREELERKRAKVL